MSEPNGNGNRWMPIMLAASLGVTVSGVGMVVRGDILGQRAADRAESRMERRVDKLERDFKSAIDDMKDSLRRIEDKLDERGSD